MKKPFKTVFASSLIFTVSLLLFSGSLQAQQQSSADSQGKTVFDIVNSKDNTSEFAKLLKQSGYSQVLKKKGSYTVLAPENKAIQQADSKLKKNPKKLMRGQLFKGNVPKKQVESSMGVKVKETDKSASNGIVYVVDRVVKK